MKSERKEEEEEEKHRKKRKEEREWSTDDEEGGEGEALCEDANDRNDEHNNQNGIYNSHKN